MLTCALYCCLLAFLSEMMCICVCVLQDIAVEVAFPQSAIYQMTHSSARWNELLMSLLERGALYHHEGYEGAFRSGSRGEGLAMASQRGHPAADLDFMYLRGGPLGVYVAGEPQLRGDSCLDFCPEGCPAAYCKLEVTDLTGLRKSTLDLLGARWCDNSCIDVSNGRQWMNTYNAVLKMKESVNLTRSDPTVASPAAKSDRWNIDTVQALVCSGPHPDLHDEFRLRPRESWPTESLIKYILQMPMLLVLVGHKGSPESEFKQQARMSWSHLEQKLIQELPESVRQGFIAFKYVMKRFLEVHRSPNDDVDGRSCVSSYHLKSVFLRFLEKRNPSEIISPSALFLCLLRELDDYLKVGKLPHYFLYQCDLLETVGDDERGISRLVINDILSDPLKALLTSPTDPKRIYGEVRPDDLVIAFPRVSSRLTGEHYWNLSELLACVDERRRLVAGQAKLVDMLQQIKIWDM